MWVRMYFFFFIIKFQRFESKQSSTSQNSFDVFLSCDKVFSDIYVAQWVYHERHIVTIKQYSKFHIVENVRTLEISKIYNLINYSTEYIKQTIDTTQYQIQ